MADGNGTVILATLAPLPLVAAVLWTATARMKRLKDARYQRSKSKHVSTAIHVSSLLLLPLIFHTLVGFDRMMAKPTVLIGLVWSTLMIVWSILSQCGSQESEHDARQSSADTRMIANIVIGSALAVGALLNVVKEDSAASKDGAKIMLLSVSLLLALVIPTIVRHDVRSPSGTALRSVQQNVLYVAMGLFISSIAVTYSG